MHQEYLKMYFFIGERIRDARLKKGLTQAELAKLAGLSSGRFVASIEEWERDAPIPEVRKIAKVLGKPARYFVDPFLLVCEQKFRYRITREVNTSAVKKFEETMRYYVGIYRFLLNYFKLKEKQRTPKFDLRLPFEVNSPPELTVNAGEIMAAILQLGQNPIDKLQSALEDKLDVMTLMLDVPQKSIAGAAISLKEASFICVNRKLPKHERAFTIAHELFHILTWDRLPFERTSRAKQKLRKIEALADLFASSLLMPRQSLVQIEDDGNNQMATQVVATNVEEIGVTTPAVQARLTEMATHRGRRFASVLNQLNLPKRITNSTEDEPALPLAKKYVELIGKGIDDAVMSTISGVHKLGYQTFDEAANLFATYDATPSQTLRMFMPDFRKKWKKIRERL